MTCRCCVKETISNLHIISILCLWSRETSNYNLLSFNRKLRRGSIFISNNSHSDSQNVYVELVTRPPGWLRVIVVEGAVGKLTPSRRS